MSREIAIAVDAGGTTEIAVSRDDDWPSLMAMAFGWILLPFAATFMGTDWRAPYSPRIAEAIWVIGTVILVSGVSAKFVVRVCSFRGNVCEVNWRWLKLRRHWVVDRTDVIGLRSSRRRWTSKGGIKFDRVRLVMRTTHGNLCIASDVESIDAARIEEVVVRWRADLVTEE